MKQDKKTALYVFLNAPQLRIDRWNKLRILVNEMLLNKEDHQQILKIENEMHDCLEMIKPLEQYWVFPGETLIDQLEILIYQKSYQKLLAIIEITVQYVSSASIEKPNTEFIESIISKDIVSYDDLIDKAAINKHYFNVLYVGKLSKIDKDKIKKNLINSRSVNDKFVYDLLFVDSFEDAIIAIMINFAIQGCIIRDVFQLESGISLEDFQNLIQGIKQTTSLESIDANNIGQTLGSVIKELRPELDLYYCTDIEPEKYASQYKIFNRVFYNYEHELELHLSIIDGVNNRYETPFFDSLKKNSYLPRSAFHALPIARARSIIHARWVKDVLEFYGKNVFMAESSSTAGGLDSLMRPVGTLKKAMKKAADCFGAKETYFVPLGTSTTNKIIMQALTTPGDIVLIDRACHKSIHFEAILAGTLPIYLNGYDLKKYSIFGTIELKTIKETLLQLKKLGQLDRVKMIVLINCTFDGLVYNVTSYMEEILAIKPDIIFHWDEAWFAYARCVPHYRIRTAMAAAKILEERYKTDSYRKEYENYKERTKGHKNDIKYFLKTHMLPDPDKVIFRVYATQSTHKSLSCLRQGSMLHIYDELFQNYKDDFSYGFIIHSTTSPNYNILATMDTARRQVHLEGFEMLQKAIELSMILRTQINSHALLKKYFFALGPSELIPEHMRASHIESGYSAITGWSQVQRAWQIDDAVIDPTRVTIDVSRTGIEGNSMRLLLMDKFGIQVNKTSFNTILVQITFGATRSSVAYFIKSLISVAEEIDAKLTDEMWQKNYKNKVKLLTTDLPDLPKFSEFHPVFRPYKEAPCGDMREAYYLSRDLDNCEMVLATDIIKRLKKGEELVAATIIIPEPPGFPILVPGQIITLEIMKFFMRCPNETFVGDLFETGIRIFKPSILAKRAKIKKP